jgi:hypothetical protein
MESRFAIKSHRGDCVLFSNKKRIVDNEKVILSVARFFSYLHTMLSFLATYMPLTTISHLQGVIAAEWERICILTMSSNIYA